MSFTKACSIRPNNSLFKVHFILVFLFLLLLKDISHIFEFFSPHCGLYFALFIFMTLFDAVKRGSDIMIDGYVPPPYLTSGSIVGDFTLLLHCLGTHTQTV